MTKCKCILCGDDSDLALKLEDGDTFHCGACGDDFATADVQEQLEAWGRMLAWVRRCPAREDADAPAGELVDTNGVPL